MNRFSHAVEEPQVYVNNMNSRIPTTIIPDSAPTGEYAEKKVVSRRGNRQGPTFVDDSAYMKSTQHGYTTGDNGAGYYSSAGMGREAALHDVTGNQNRKGENGETTKVVLSNGDELHTNLQAAYNRIMRRLQRELNYEKYNQVPLVTEFGIVPPEPDEEERRHNFRIQDNNPMGEKISMPFLDSRTTSFSESRSITPHLRSNNGITVPLASSPRLSLHSLLPAINDQGRRYEGKRNMTSFRVEPCKKDEVGDVEYSLAQQPCPETLRLVIQHLTQTVVKKMELAMRNSLRDVFRFAFDCKTLFDRLLKEIPSYSAFQGNAELLNPAKKKTGNERYSAAMQMHELYQELRKAPVVLPRGDYARDVATGSIVAVLTDAGSAVTTGGEEKSNGSSAVLGGNSGHPGHASGRTQLENSSMKDTGVGSDIRRRESSLHSALSQTQALASPLFTPSPDPGSVDTGVSNFTTEDKIEDFQGFKPRGMGRGTEVDLPPGYGKSARIYATSAEELKPSGKGSGHYSETTTTPAFGSDGNYTSRGVPVSENVSVDAGGYHSSDGTGLAGHKGDSNTGRVGMGFPTTTAAGKATGMAGTPGLVRNAPFRRKNYSETHRQAYEGMMISVGTLTDEYSANIVSKEEYDKLFQHVQQLEVQIAEARSETNTAMEHLLQERNHTGVRARIIQYLRETIFRECNVLRSRLALAEQKEHYHHHPQHLPTRGGSFLHVPPASSPSFVSANPQNSVTGMNRTGGPFNDHSGASVYRRKLSTNSKSAIGNPNTSRVGGPSDLRGGASGGGDPLVNDYTPIPTNEIGKVQSLLDLALLAVETESVLTEGQWKSSLERNPSNFRNPKREMEEMTAVHEERERKLKERIAAMKTHYNRTIVEKDQEIARLRKLNDLQYVQKTIMASVQELKQSLLRMKNNISDLLTAFRLMLFGSLHTLGNKATLMDQEVDNYFSLKSAYSSLLDLVKSAHSLFMPMLTSEYSHGYHPWPTKIRNTVDPLGHVVQTHSGSAEVLRLREPLAHFSDLYIAIHKFSMSTLIVPDPSRPTWGRQLSQICSAMVLSPLATIDLIYTIRIRYDKEVQFRKSIARLNFQILWKAHLQRVFTERCVSALVEGEMDPHTTVMPITRTVNRLAEDRAYKARERSGLQKERMDNAKELYAFWRDRQIDIYEGDAIPKTQNRVAILSSVQSYGPGLLAGGPMHIMKGGRRSSFSQRTASLAF